LSPLKVNVPPAAFIVVRPSYVLLPEKVVVPVEVMVTLLAAPMLVAPFPIVEATFTFPAPANVRVRSDDEPSVLRFRPPLNVVVEPKVLDQVPFPFAFLTSRLKTWFVPEEFTRPPGRGVVPAKISKALALAPLLEMV
jgi:hypothetical protein